MNHLAHLQVLVLGLGDSGLAMARWCAAQGAVLRVWDSRQAPPQAEALRQAVPQASLHTGALDEATCQALLAGVTLVLKSPGLSPRDERIAPLLAAARAAGTAVAGELDLFACALADLKAERGYAPKLLAITGTNGKTTTTAMCAQLVERCGLRVAVAGNIGPSMLDTLADALAREPAPAQALERADEATPAADAAQPGRNAHDYTPVAIQTPTATAEGNTGETNIDGDADADASADTDTDTGADTATAENSDAQAQALADASAAAPQIGGDELGDDSRPLTLVPPPAAAPVFEVLPEVWVLELSSFQLDGVQGFAPDAAALLNITQDHLDWHGSLAAYTEAKARVFGPGAVMVINRDDAAVEALVPAPVLVKAAGRGQRSRTVQRRVARFGLDAPRHPGDFGLVVENGMAWLVRAREADETLKRHRASRVAEDDDIILQRLMPADALRVRGRHNAANALAALALACAIGCPLAPMLHGLRDYAGEPHRLAFVARVAEVEAYDDSKGTNVGATVAALTGLGADKAPSKLVVVLGGDGKGQDFSPLAAPVAQHARAVALIGRDANTIAQALANTGVPLQHHDSLEAAVAWCFAQARPGDAVLLSPACASLDMFRNYAHRAEVFVGAVLALAEASGEVAL